MKRCSIVIIVITLIFLAPATALARKEKRARRTPRPTRTPVSTIAKTVLVPANTTRPAITPAPTMSPELSFAKQISPSVLGASSEENLNVMTLVKAGLITAGSLILILKGKKFIKFRR